MMIAPAARSLETTSASLRPIPSIAADPQRYGRPSTSMISFTRTGTPASAPVRGCSAAALRAPSASRCTTAFNRLHSSARCSACSTNSTGFSRPDRTAAAISCSRSAHMAGPVVGGERCCQLQRRFVEGSRVFSVVRVEDLALDGFDVQTWHLRRQRTDGCWVEGEIQVPVDVCQQGLELRVVANHDQRAEQPRVPYDALPGSHQLDDAACVDAVSAWTVFARHRSDSCVDAELS